MPEPCTLYCDGASRGNPGPASIGAVLFGADGATMAEVSVPIGKATNNVAEYRSLIAGLEAAREKQCSEIVIRMDSQLAVFQVLGRYKVKNEGLRPLHKQVGALLRGFSRWQIEHVPREQNAHADRLANAALDGS